MDPKNVMMTTVHGMSEPHIGAANLQKVFPQTRVLQGTCRDVLNVSDWLSDHRRDLQMILNNHFGQGRPTQYGANRTAAFDELYSFLRSSIKGSVTLLCLGPLSNVAQWLVDQGPLLEDKLSCVFILGGNDPILQTSHPEFNFAQDAAAAKQVLASPHIAPKIRLVLGCDTAPNKHSHVVSEVKQLTRRQHGFLACLLHEYPEQACFDPICAFLMEQPNMAKLERHKAVVCDKTGLLRICNTNGFDLSFPREISIETGYLPWIRKSLRAYELKHALQQL